MTKRIDLTGMKFVRLTVIELSHINKRKKAVWKCKCDCGNYAYPTTDSLNRMNTMSCGCLKIDATRKANSKHGHSVGNKTPEYRIWKNIRSRCLLKTNPRYHEYGGRGIKICERWNDYSNFLSDVGSRPSSKHSLDRIDVNGNYEPSNCRWTTADVQARNKRIKNPTGVPGVRRRKDSGKWHAVLKIKGKVIHLGLFEKLEDAIKARKDAEKIYLGDSCTA